MARVVCECGQSFAPFLLNGVPRSSCPFCKRELSLGSDGTLSGTRPLTPAETTAKRVAPAIEQAPGSLVGSSASGVADTVAPRAVLHDAPVEPSGIATPPSLPRFSSEKLLDSALGRLSQFVALELGKQKHAVACPHGKGCVPVDCSQAFECGALPNVGSGRRYILIWTLGSAGAIAAFLALMFSIFALAMPPGARDHPVNYVGLGLGLAGFPIVAGGLGFAYASLASRWQQRYIRALATATRATGMNFLPLVEVPRTLAEQGFPVICPTPTKADLFGDTPRARVNLAGSGELDGHTAHLAQFIFHFDPNDHLPHGGFLKVAQTIAKPGTALSAQKRCACMSWFSSPNAFRGHQIFSSRR